MTAKNSRISQTIPILTVICLLSFPARAQFAGGSGTADDPYQIATAAQLHSIGSNEYLLDKHFVLVNDIDLAPGTFWNAVIAPDPDMSQQQGFFTGSFDGAGHCIENMTIRVQGERQRFVGLFGAVGSLLAGGHVYNLRLCDCDVVVKGSGSDYVGGLAGFSWGTVTDCHVAGSVSGERRVGGLVGYSGDTVADCEFVGSVSGQESVGGLVGRTSGNCTIATSYAAGSVTGDKAVGGLVGDSSHATISNCYATSSVSGSDANEESPGIGGLVGENPEGGIISKCYSVGRVTSAGTWGGVGGLVGLNSGGLVYDSFWDVETSGLSWSGGGTGKTTAEMQDINTFLAAGWDFVGEVQNGPSDHWAMPVGGGYPILWWQLASEPDLPTFSGGTGTPDDPYLVSTANELNSIGDNPRLMNAHFRLIDDIDLIGVNFFIIGSGSLPFTGVFDGNGHTIFNFSYSSTHSDNVGLFGYLAGEDAEIKDMGLVEPNVDAGIGRSVGSLVGCNGGRITDCYAQDGSVSGASEVGGLVGHSTGTITDCHSSAGVMGTTDVGGLVGHNHYGTITKCHSSGNVSGGNHVGGLLGYNRYYGAVSECYATGTATGTTNVGGLVGYGGTISNCYATVAVSGSESVGGLVGGTYWGTVNNCYSAGSVTGTTNVGGLIGLGGGAYASYWDTETSGQSTSHGGTGKTTAEMQTAATYVGWGRCGDEGVWTIDEGRDYPRLWWENRPGEVLETEQLSDLLTGTGTEDDPYLIYTTREFEMLTFFPCEWGRRFKLMADIDLCTSSGTQVSPIGIRGSYEIPFSGVFDGNSHTISNFNCTSTGIRCIGLFGYVEGEDAEIRDLGLVDPNVDAGTEDRVGSLVGYMDGGTISYCYAQGGSVSGEDSVGGLVGINNNGTVSNCRASSTVSGQVYVGGLVGYAHTIVNCSSSGSVSGSRYVGGLVGRSGRVTNCSSSGDVSGDDKVGGLIGDASGTVSKCCATGSVSGSRFVGGLVGEGRIVTNCSSSSDVWGDDEVGGLIGGASGTVSKCCASGSVSGSRFVGGLLGDCDGTVSNCYATGSVSGDALVGGLLGDSYSAGTVTNSYASGPVTGTTKVGGLAGNGPRNVHNCFWDIMSTGQATSDGGTGRTTAEMQMETTFTDAGWDFVGESVNGTVDIWTVCQGTNYPRFVRQIPVADFVCPDGVTAVDFSFLATYWLDDNCDLSNDYCQGTDLDLSGVVDAHDLEAFADNWLTEGTCSVVIPDFIIVDDFEDYNYYPPDRIFETWIDGYGYSEPAPGKEGNGTGSTVGYLVAPFAEQTIVHGGGQSMPFGYDNTLLPYYSEAEREYPAAEDFTRRDVKSLSLWIYGDSGNAPSEVYIALQDSTGARVDVAETNTNLVLTSDWQQITIALSKFEPVNLASIKKIYIGAGDRADPKPGGKGTLYIDDIELH